MLLQPGRYSKKINDLIRSGGFDTIMKEDLHTKQGQQKICDVLELHQLVRDNCKIAPAEESDPHQMIVSFLEDLNGKVLVHGSMADGNHRIIALLACILLKVAKPGVEKGLMKPGHRDYLSNSNMPNWKMRNDETDNESAMKDCIDKMVNGGRSELLTPIALTIYTVGETSDNDVVTSLMTHKSVVQGKKNSGTSTPSLSRQLQGALRAMHFGDKEHVMATETRSENLEIQLEERGKTRYAKSNTVMTTKCLPFLNELLAMEKNYKLSNIRDAKGTVHELDTTGETHVAVGDGTPFPPCLGEENLWIDLESNDDLPRINFIQSMRSPMILQAACNYLGIKYEPSLGRAYCEIMKKNPLSLEDMVADDREKLKIAYGTGDDVKFTGKPNDVSMALILTNFWVNLMIADEVSPDGEKSKFKVAVTNLSKLASTGYSEQDLTNLMCKCITCDSV